MLFKIELFLLLLSIVEAVRVLFYMVMQYFRALPVEMTWYQKLEFMVALSYIFTIIFGGFGL